MSNKEDKQPKEIGTESGDAEKGSKKRKHEETAPINIPSTSRGSVPSLDLPPWVAGGSPIKFVAPEELLNMSVAMDNLALVHEIAIDPNFRIENAPVNPIEEAVRENMYKAYWDLLREDLAKDPPSYEQAFKLLLEIKQELLDSMLSERHVRLRAEVNLILNEETLRSQLNEGNLNVKAVSIFILELLNRLCCPERDEMIAKLREEDGIVELISGIFRLIDIMKNDLTNYAISQNRRLVEDHSAEMEYKTFMKYLEKGSNLTREWLKKAFLELYPPTAEPAVKRDCETTEESEYMKITARAYVNLVRHVDASPFPETLRIDQARYLVHAFKFLQCTITGSAVLVTCNISGKEITESAGFKTLLKEHLYVLSDDIHLRGVPQILADFAVQCVKDAQDAATKLNVAITTQQEDLIKSQISALSSETHPVRHLVYTRIGTFMEDVLRNPRGQPHSLGAGISVIEKDLFPLTARILRITSHNRKTFERLYKKLISEILAEAEESPVVRPDPSSSSA